MLKRLTNAIVAAMVLGLAAAGAPAALANGPVGRDPAANIPLGAVPDSCNSAPTGADCIAGVISDLNQARAQMGLGPYQVPGNFAALTPAQQTFVLTDLDRVAYGLPPIAGLTDALGADAAKGVQNDTDPSSSDPSFGYWTSNWAGGFPNVVMAYYAWMYDDGPGSGNLDCTQTNTTGCWGHRHNILWQFDGSGPLAMGAAAGLDPGGTTGYAMLLGEGDASFRPTYTYTWAQAVAAGASGGATGGPAPTSSGPSSGSASTGASGSAGASAAGGTGTTAQPATKLPAVTTSVPRRHGRAAVTARRHRHRHRVTRRRRRVALRRARTARSVHRRARASRA